MAGGTLIAWGGLWKRFEINFQFLILNFESYLRYKLQDTSYKQIPNSNNQNLANVVDCNLIIVCCRLICQLLLIIYFLFLWLLV